MTLETLTWLENNGDNSFITSETILDRYVYKNIVLNPKSLKIIEWLESKGLVTPDHAVGHLVQMEYYDKKNPTKLADLAKFFGWPRILNSPNNFKIFRRIYNSYEYNYESFGKFIMEHKCVSISAIQDMIPDLVNKRFWLSFLVERVRKLYNSDPAQIDVFVCSKEVALKITYNFADTGHALIKHFLEKGWISYQDLLDMKKTRRYRNHNKYDELVKEMSSIKNVCIPN